MITILVAGLLVATDGAPHQNDTGRMMQVQAAKDIAQTIEPGATVDEVAEQTRRMGVPDVALTRCPAGKKCTKAFDEKGATRRTDTWMVSDHTLVVVYCGGAKAWRVAAVDLSTADRPDPLGGDKLSVFMKKDPDLAKGCEAQ
jgi:hypothetical protein